MNVYMPRVASSEVTHMVAAHAPVTETQVCLQRFTGRHYYWTSHIQLDLPLALNIDRVEVEDPIETFSETSGALDVPCRQMSSCISAGTGRGPDVNSMRF